MRTHVDKKNLRNGLVSTTCSAAYTAFRIGKEKTLDSLRAGVDASMDGTAASKIEAGVEAVQAYPSVVPRALCLRSQATIHRCLRLSTKQARGDRTPCRTIQRGANDRSNDKLHIISARLS